MMKSRGRKVFVRVYFKKIHADAIIPTKAYQDDAGIDFYSIEDVVVPAKGFGIVRTGLKCELVVDNDYELIPYLQIIDKSGMAFKRNLHVVAGVVDAGFRGEITIKLWNFGDEDVFIKKHQKIAQGIVFLVPFVLTSETDTLSESERGEGGFGSTGEFFSETK